MGTFPSKLPEEGGVDILNSTPRSESPVGGPPDPKSDGVFQAGGHGNLSRDSTIEGTIRKAGQEAEILFYQTLNGDDPQLQHIPFEIRSFFPKFHGVQEKKYIVMEDLTYNLRRACVMDVKMGTRTYTNDSNILKQWLLESKDSKTTTQALGFRITGFRVFNRKQDEYDVKGKAWGAALRPEDIPEALKVFFHDGNVVRVDVIRKYIDKLETLLDWYSGQNTIKLFSSSLLFVYDADGTIDSATVHMIDFAHVQRIEDPNDRDTGYISGLKSLIDILRNILSTFEPKPKKKKRYSTPKSPSNSAQILSTSETSESNVSHEEQKPI